MAKGINQFGCSGLDYFYLAYKQPLNFVAKADRLKGGGFNLIKEIKVHHNDVFFYDTLFLYNAQTGADIFSSYTDIPITYC